MRSWPDEQVRRRPAGCSPWSGPSSSGCRPRSAPSGWRGSSGWWSRGPTAWVPVEAELVRELARQGKGAEVHARAERLRPHADEVSRARLLMAESLVDLLHHEDEAVASSYDMLHEATALLRVNGEREWEADAWLSLGFGADYRAGRVGLAVEHIERALALSASGTQMRGRVLTFLAEVLSVAGRPDEAEAALREVAELAAARVGRRPDGVHGLVGGDRGLPPRRPRRHPRPARGGEAQPGRVVPAPRRGRLPRRGGRDARHSRGVRRGARAPAGRPTPTRRRATSTPPSTWPSWCWPRGTATLPRCPSWRRGVPAPRSPPGGSASSRPGPPSAPVTRDRAQALAADALGAAAALGHPEIVEAVEPELALWARALAGSAAATPAGATRRRVRLCGEVAVEGPQGVRVPRRGDETTLLAAVAARQDVDSRRGARAALARPARVGAAAPAPQHPQPARGSVGEVVVRRGDRLALAPERRGRRARRARRSAGSGTRCPSSRVEAARRALAAGRRRTPESGTDPVLDDLRDELALAVGTLADRVADAATTAGELGEAARYLTQARRLDRYDETRAARLVRVLRALGRDAEADEVLADALRACAELGVPPSPELAARF